MPSTWIVVGLSPCFQLRCASGYTAGPWRTVPLRWNRDPWHGQSSVLSVALNATEHPRCEQFCANTCTLPASSFDTKPPNASSPGALSPPPSAMMKAEFGLVGELNLTAVPLGIWSIACWIETAMLVFF